MNTEEIARAFSGHRFEETFDRMAPDAVWTVVGRTRVEGRDAIIDACRAATDETATVGTRWLRFVSTGSGPVVAVDSLGRYSGPEGVSVVSSCDVYEFEAGTLTTITSYAVEVPDPG